MYKRLSVISLVFLLCASAFSANAADSVEREFASPPDSARPWVYWFWMNGNITREGITADLEAMHDVGIGGCLIMHVKLGEIGGRKGEAMPPDGPITFMSQEFREMFRHAVREADRLGMKIDMNNADGFTGSGGPWVPVEKSMKKLVWSETSATGGRALDLRLPQPETILGFYGDTAVIAYPRQTPLAEQFAAAKPIFTAANEKFDAALLTDEDPATRAPIWHAGLEGGPNLMISFPKPYTADTLVIQGAGTKGGPPEVTLEISDDAKTFRRVGNISFKWYPAAPTDTVRFDACTARYYRLSFAPNTQQVALGGVALGRSNKIHYWEPKAGFTRFGEWGAGAGLYTDRKTTPEGGVKLAPVSEHPIPAIPADKVFDLTSKMDGEGRLQWDAPEGEWTILRIGYTSTGTMNHPASEGGHGLECDKLQPYGAEAAFKGMLQKLIDDNKELAGKSFSHAHIDSWEVGIQNWTEGMAGEFQRRNGYDLTPFYPLLVAGNAVESNDTSERFLWDLRKTLLDMVSVNYLERVKELCHENGLQFSSEAGGRQTFLQSPVYLLTKSDLPMGEFWPHEGTPRIDGKAAASVAHLYGKPLVGAEAFTGGGDFAAWENHPYRLKGIGDEAFCLGINHYVVHYSVHQAYEGFRPGFAMGPWGIHLDRMNTWWKQSKAWLQYVARCQYLLRQGNFIADVLYFPGEDAPYYFGKRDSLSVPLPPGYDYDGCDPETLMERLTVKDGRIVLPHGPSYRYLMLPQSDTMTPELARRVRELVEAGATIIGPPPKRSPSLRNYPQCDKEVQSVQELWDAGKIIWGKTFAEIAQGDSLPPDCDFTSKFPETDIRYIHRQTGGMDLYFVANRTEHETQAEVSFRIAGKQPELWHPEDGSARNLTDWRATSDGRTRIPLKFDPLESYFIVFRKSASPPASGRPNFQEFTTVAAIPGPWELEFPPGLGAPDSTQLPDLMSWTEHDSWGVQHFSGTATYRNTFTAPPDAKQDASKWYLDLGDVQVIAEVTLNGKHLDTLWKPPFRISIGDALKPGKNTLEIQVTNLWPNRLIGDEQFPADFTWGTKFLEAWPDWFLEGKPRPEPRRKTFTVVKHYNKNSPLLPSGLLGPVTLKKTRQ